MHARIGPIPFHIVELSSFRDAEHSADGRRTRFPFAMTSLVRIADTERSPRYQNIILRKPRAKQTTYFRIKKTVYHIERPHLQRCRVQLRWP